MHADKSNSLLTRLEGQIHVWIAGASLLSAARLAEKYLPILDPDERMRYSRLLHERDRSSYLSAHALLRTTLSRYSTKSPKDWSFIYGVHGKPEIRPESGAPSLRFNLSHTTEMSACIVTLERQCGIDIEKIRPMADIHPVAQLVFSDEELTRLQKGYDSDALDRFFELWTLKEAFVKATGVGLNAPLKQISFDIDAPQLSVRFGPEIQGEPTDWMFERYRPTTVHRLAVAAFSKGSADTVIYSKVAL